MPSNVSRDSFAYHASHWSIVPSSAPSHLSTTGCRILADDRDHVVLMGLASRLQRLRDAIRPGGQVEHTGLLVLADLVERALQGSRVVGLSIADRPEVPPHVQPTGEGADKFLLGSHCTSAARRTPTDKRRCTVASTNLHIAFAYDALSSARYTTSRLICSKVATPTSFRWAAAARCRPPRPPWPTGRNRPGRVDRRR